MADLQFLIANLGFPIAISLYLLVRIEGKLQALTDSIAICLTILLICPINKEKVCILLIRYAPF